MTFSSPNSPFSPIPYVPLQHPIWSLNLSWYDLLKLIDFAKALPCREGLMSGCRLIRDALRPVESPKTTLAVFVYQIALYNQRTHR